MSQTTSSQIKRNGTDVIILPEGMSHDEALNRITADKEQATYGEQDVTIVEVIHRFPFEAAYALAKAAKELHDGLINHKTMDDSPKLIGVPISVTESVQVPWGPFHLPDIGGEFRTEAVKENNAMALRLTAKVKRKHQEKVKKLAQRTRELAESESIYRGKALMVKFHDKDGELSVVPPTFMDLSGDHEVIFSETIMREIKVNILVPIKYAEMAKKLKVPTKRGVLLSGTFGSGKTLTARWMAKEATAMGRTFIYVKDASELGDALRFAALYSPAMIFGEDIDRAIYGSRTGEMDQVLNTVDGVDTKNLDVITVLTTNNLYMIHAAFLREGRMDTIIEIDKPDHEAIEKLLRHFGAGLIGPNERLRKLAGLLTEVEASPAFIREVVERSKLEKILELDGADVESIALTAQDLEIAFYAHRDEREKVVTVTDNVEFIREAEARGFKIVDSN